MVPFDSGFQFSLFLINAKHTARILIFKTIETDLFPHVRGERKGGVEPPLPFDLFGFEDELNDCVRMYEQVGFVADRQRMNHGMLIPFLLFHLFFVLVGAVHYYCCCYVCCCCCCVCCCCCCRHDDKMLLPWQGLSLVYLLFFKFWKYCYYIMFN